MNPALTVNNLSRSYGKRRAVHDLNLSVEEGDVYGFLGPNGAGKTTAMRCILGLIRRDSGTVTMFGDPHPVTQRKQVGAIIETPAFHDWMSATNNLRQAGWYSGMAGKLLDDNLQRVLERVGLRDRAAERVGTYSLGMRQRLAIARCLLANPKMLFLDEPTNGLDPAGMRDMRELIRSLAMHDQITIIISSHLLIEVQAICNRVGILNEGKMKAEGHVAELLRNSGQPTFRIQSPDPERLQEVVRTLANVTIGTVDGEGLLVHTDLPPHELNRLLFDQQLSLSQLTPIERTLEDVFIEIVK